MTLFYALLESYGVIYHPPFQLPRSSGESICRADNSCTRALHPTEISNDPNKQMMSPLIYIAFEVRSVNAIQMRQYEDFFVMLAENQMKSKLLEYCSVNIPDATTEINSKRSFLYLCLFSQSCFICIKVGAVWGKCCSFFFLRSNRLYYLEEVFPMLPSMCPHASLPGISTLLQTSL